MFEAIVCIDEVLHTLFNLVPAPSVVGIIMCIELLSISANIKCI